LKELIQQTKEALARLSFKPSRNLERELSRLIFELARLKKETPSQIIGPGPFQSKKSLLALKKRLLRERFAPWSKELKARDVYLPSLHFAPEQEFVPHKDFQFTPKRIYYEKGLENPFLQNILHAFPKAEKEEIPTLKDYISEQKRTSSIDNYNKRRDKLFITRERYDFFKPCPCSKKVVSCNYYIFNLGFGCIYDCSYCYLQQYTDQPGIMLPANLDDFLREFEPFWKKRKVKNMRLGSGEFTDSLALDDITGYSKELIPFFSKFSVRFELKTKSSKIENLLKVKPASNIVISWSLNPEKIIQEEEYYTAGLKERLTAACQCSDAGYSIGFHFDPIIAIENWKEGYRKLIEQLFAVVKDKEIAWISLGTVRFNRKLKPIAEARFPRSEIFLGPLFLQVDGKMRYPQKLRLDIYQNMLKWIRKYNKKVWVYLCMEDKEVWEKTFAL